MERLTLPLRILVVATRPGALRARVEALYDALEDQSEMVEVEWLWPATWEALKARLEIPRAGVGAIYLDIPTDEDAAGWAFRFEGARVPVEELAVQLRQWGVHLMVLAAARSSLCAALSATVSLDVLLLHDDLHGIAVRQALTAFWGALLAGHAPSRALADAQQALRQGKPHRPSLHSGIEDTPPETTLGLWHVGPDSPLVQTASAKPGGIGKIVHFPSPALLPAWRRLPTEPEVGGLPPEPEQGFVGRDAELAALEYALRSTAGNGLVLVHGYVGIGKTTLVAHAARWLVRTGRFMQVVYANLAGGGYPEAVLYELGKRLLGDNFSLSEGNAVEAVEQALVETPTLVIWDGLEALLEGGPRALETKPLGELLQLSVRFARAGESRVCVLSEESSIPNPAYRDGTLSLDLALHGLNAADGHALLVRAWRVWNPHPADDAPAPSPDEFTQFVSVLGGHPLALCVLAQLLREQPSSALWIGLEQTLPGLSKGEARLRNQALYATLEVLLRSFPEELQPSLLAFGLFVNGCMEPLVSSVCGLEPGTWATCKQRLTAARLLREVRLPGLSVPFTVLHPSWTQHLARRLSVEQRVRLQQSYTGAYLGLLNWMLKSEQESPLPIRTLAWSELPNLRQAAWILLENTNLTLALDYIPYLQHFIDELGFSGERDALTDRVKQAVEKAVPAEGPLGRPGVQLMLRQSEQLLSAEQLREATMLLQNLCQRMEQEGGLSYAGDEAIYDQGVALHRLGRCARSAGQGEAALAAYSRALGLFQGVTPGASVQPDLAQLYQDVGDVFLTGMDFDQAESAYSQSLAIATELQDRQMLGAVYGQLGNIAIGRQDLERARSLFRMALENLQALDDNVGMAVTWGQLGMVAWQSSDLSEAEDCYRQALALAQKADHWLLQAQTHTQLGQIAAQAGRAQDAEVGYVQALGIYQAHNMRPALVATELALARLCLGQGQMQNAHNHAEAARAAAEGLGPEAHPWEVYALLQHIAIAEDDATRAAHWRTCAQESFAASPEAAQVLQNWAAVIRGVAQACRGETLENETVALLEDMEKNTAWQLLVATLWRTLSGERDAELYRDLDHVDALIVRRILELIESPEPEEPATPEGPTANGNLGFSLPNLLTTAWASLNDNPQAQAMLPTMLASLQQEHQPEALHRLAAALTRIMQGARDASVLEGLPDELATPVQALLDGLNSQGQS